MDFSNFINVALIMAIITIIETTKRILKANKIEFNDDVWKIVALCSGFPFGFLISAIDGFNVWDAIVKGFIYSGSAVLCYQTGKLGLSAIFSKKEDDGKD